MKRDKAMPISVPPALKAELDFALNKAKLGGYFAVGSIAVHELYNYIKKELEARNVPFTVHKDKTTIPHQHHYWEP
jgi:hypothetical protein